MTIVLADTTRSRRAMYPLSLTRTLANLRIGLFTLRQCWEHLSKMPVSVISESYLQEPWSGAQSGLFICIDSSIIPTPALAEMVLSLQAGSLLEDDDGIIAFASETVPKFNQLPVFGEKTHQTTKAERIRHPLDLVRMLANRIKVDMSLLSQHLSVPPDPSNQIFGTYPVFIAPGVHMQGCTLNATEGPIYIGDDAHIMEGTLMRGPVAIGQGSVVKMGTRLYGGTVIGHFCTVGGEIKNSLVMDYSNKAHDGYLGDSVIGSWCNLGAGTSNSNVRNNAEPIKVWHELNQQYEPWGLKAGVVMGDYCRTAIHTALGSGATIGICCSIHEPIFFQKHIPSFSWGPGEKYHFDKAIRDINNWKTLKNKMLQPAETAILRHVYRQLS